MTDRRSFFRIAGAGAALAALADARSAFAASLERVPGSLRTGGLPEALAGEYMLRDDVLYFNHGSIGTIPRVVHDARVRLLELCETNPHLYMWAEPWQQPREDVRAHAAGFMNCDADEVAITHNTTEGFNLLAQGLPLGPGDEVVFSSLNHPGASNAWTHQAAARGFTVRRFDFPIVDTPSLTAADVVAIHVRELSDRTRVLVFPHIDNIVGLRHPVRELAAAARARGVDIIAVDGAQALGMVPVDVRAFGVDVYAASPHKWLQAPKGLGLLYVRSEVQGRIRPMWVGSGMGSGEGTARIFESYGTRNFAEALTLGDCIAFQRTVDRMLADAGTSRMARHRATWQRFRDAVDAAPALAWYSPRDWDLSASLFLIGVDGRPSAELSDTLFRDHGAVFRPFRTQGIDGSRISPNVQTTDAEVERMIGLLRP
jgi:isopenicillin-N epimerase